MISVSVQNILNMAIAATQQVACGALFSFGDLFTKEMWQSFKNGEKSAASRKYKSYVSEELTKDIVITQTKKKTTYKKK